MGNLAITKTKKILIHKERHLITDTLIEKLKLIVTQTYQLPEKIDFFNLFIDEGIGTEMALFYGEYGDLAGFATANMLHLKIQDKTHAIYQGRAFFDTLYLDNLAAAKFGLTHAMKYKLSHPEQVLGHIAEVTTPWDYNLYSRIINIFYPQPYFRVPEHVKKILAHIKEQRQLITQNHPLIVRHAQNFSLKPKQTTNAIPVNKQLFDFYIKLNPDYQSGNALLIYIPLDLTNISHGLRKVIEQNQVEAMAYG